MMREIKGCAITTVLIAVTASPVLADVDGVVTEAVEPGVERVLADDARHAFAFGHGRSRRLTFDALASGPDGAVYVLSHRDPRRRRGTDPYPGRLWQIGEPASAVADIPSSLIDLAVGHDGTVWAAGEGRFLARFDGDRWRIVRPQRGFAELLALSVGPDGTVWGAWQGRAPRPDVPGTIARFDGNDWVDVLGSEWRDEGGRTLPFKLVAGPDGEIWAGVGPGGSLARFDGTSWQLQWPLGAGAEHTVHALARDADDEVWALVGAPETSELLLAHGGPGGWEASGGSDGLPQCASQWRQDDWTQDRGRFMELGPDRTAWLLHADGGLVGYDGQMSRRYLADVRVTDLAIDSAGHVWAFADDGRRATADLYLIRPGDDTASPTTPICPAADDVSDTSAEGTPDEELGSTAPELLAELEQAEQLWESARPASYVYAVERICFCPRKWRGPVRVTVEGADVTTRAYVGSGRKVSRSVADSFPAVEGLFGLIREAIEGDAHAVDVTYDPVLGVPTQVDIDYDVRAVDEELGIRITEAVEPS